MAFHSRTGSKGTRISNGVGLMVSGFVKMAYMETNEGAGLFYIIPDLLAESKVQVLNPMLRDITMKKFRIFSVVCAFGLSMAQVKAEDQFLVDDGKAYAEIIISESPARSTRLAAAELQTCVAKISGARLPIRAEPSADVPVQIYVGERPHAAKLGVTADRLEHGAYRIASGDKWLTLIGDLALGTYRTIASSKTNTGSAEYFSGLQGAARLLTRSRRAISRFNFEILSFLDRKLR
jgi:hypothetical protein